MLAKKIQAGNKQKQHRDFKKYYEYIKFRECITTTLQYLAMHRLDIQP